MYDFTVYVITCFCAAMLQSLCGFGSGVFIMSVLPHFFSAYTFSLVLSPLVSLVICLAVLGKEYRHINIRMIIPAIIGNAAAVTSIMFFWSGNADDAMKKLLGCFLILLSIYFIFFNSSFKIKQTPKAGVLAGILGGTANSFFSMGGPPAVAYFIATCRNNKEYIASSQAYFSFSCIFVTTSRYVRGMITDDIWPFFLAGLPFIALGTWAGLKLFGMLNVKMLRLTIYIFMAVSGAVMIFTN